MQLFIDTHTSQTFSIALVHASKHVIIDGNDPSIELIATIERAKKEIGHDKIDEIIFVRGPGSLTGLRIGSSFALGIALGLDAKIRGFSIADAILEKYDANLFFYTGTKKWVHKTKTQEQIVELTQITSENAWISNNAEKLANTLNIQQNIPYPRIIELMIEMQHLANNTLELIYYVNLFDQTK